MEKRKHTNPDGTVTTIYVGGWATIGGMAAIGEGATIGGRAKIGAGARRYAVRSDSYVFTVGTLNGVPTVWAGCRKFNEPQARAHWGDPAHPHRDETLAILDFLFR